MNIRRDILLGLLPTWYQPDGLVSTRRKLEEFLLAQQFVDEQLPKQKTPSAPSPAPAPSALPVPPVAAYHGSPPPVYYQHPPGVAPTPGAFIPVPAAAKKPPPAPPAGNSPSPESVQIQERINIVKDMIARNDAEALAALHDNFPTDCFLHLGKGGHRLLECNKCVELTKAKQTLFAKAISLAKTPLQKFAQGKRGPSGGSTSPDAAQKLQAQAHAAALAQIQNNTQTKVKQEEDYSYLSCNNKVVSKSSVDNLKPHSHTITHVRTAVSDTGATDHMSGVKELFYVLFPFSNQDAPKVCLGDNSTIQATGWGLLDYMEQGKRIRRVALYVPQLGSNTMISISRHIQYDGCYFLAENNTAILSYPTHQCNLHLNPELHSAVTPTRLPDQLPDFDETIATSASKADFATSLVPSSILEHLSVPASAPFVQTALFHPLHATAIMPSPNPSNPLQVTSPSPITIQPLQSTILPLGCRMTLPTTASSTFVSSDPTSLTVTMSSSAAGIVLRLTNTSSKTQSFSTLGHISVSDNIAGPMSLCPPTETVPLVPSSSSDQKRGFVHLADDEFVFFDTTRHRHFAKRVALPHADPATLDPDVSDDSSAANTNRPTLYRPISSPKPIPRPWNHVPSSTPAKVSFTPERLLKSIGFLSSSKMQKALESTSLPTVDILNLDKNPTLDPGETASLRAANRNKDKSPLPDNIGDVYHCDIGFGPTKAIGGVMYTLMFVDKKTRHKFVYPLENLTSDILTQVKQFLIDVNGICKAIRTDFDMKLIGGRVKEFLIEKQIDIDAAPPRQQHKNGLVERSWQSVVKMARNWLASSALPSQYWWFAVKRATEVANILPTFHLGDDNPTTPHEMFYGEKPDLRNLIPMFTVTWVNRPTSNKFESRSLKCIIVGRDSRSNGYLFHHPPTKTTFVDGNEHRFDFNSTAGPSFGIQYDGAFTFTSKASLDSILHRPAPFSENQQVFVPSTHDPQVYVPAVVIEEPVNPSTAPYTVRYNNGDISQVPSSSVKETLQDEPPTTDPVNPSAANPALPWLQHDARATFSHPSLGPKPKWGLLKCDPSQPIESAWTFAAGKKGQGKVIDLPNFCEKAHTLLAERQLTQGWKNIRNTGIARRMRCLSNAISRQISTEGFNSCFNIPMAFSKKVSAEGLDLCQSPTLLTHSQLTDNDKALWDASYAEEYNGLRDLGTWSVITEKEYRDLLPVVGRALPSMAISTIKYDGDGNPDRCKYRIVVLGNLDPNDWSKSECFAPVLSQMELRLLLSIATAKKCVPKTGDVSQAFVQSTLPSNEQYVIRPPPGCPLSLKGSYLKLLKTLYGLKRSPRHWYEKARKTLISLGLKPLAHSPCIFTGTIIPGQPPLYIGLYVDDFIYFSESAAVEKVFESKFGNLIKTSFNGPVTHFLGITFTTNVDAAGNVTITLSQLPFIESLLHNHELDSEAVNSTPTPYRSGLPIDTIPDIEYPKAKQDELTAAFQHIVGCFQWLTVSTRPDIATVTNLLSRYLSKPSQGHLDHCRHVLRYLKGTKDLGISFSTSSNATLSAFIHSPVEENVVALADANWGAQDQSTKNLNTETLLPLFKSRSLSGYLVWLNGPLHWISKRQTITARSTAEAEIYATDECTKNILHIRFLLEDMNLLHLFAPSATVLHNDNAACVQWSRNMTTKGLRHVQNRENAVRESVTSGDVDIQHIAGNINLADLFTKEDRDHAHFHTLRDAIMTKRISLASARRAWGVSGKARLDRLSTPVLPVPYSPKAC
jgi:hypothetical protein